MSRLDYWNKKIQEKRKSTSWSTYITEIASWFPLVFYKRGGEVCRYPESDRVHTDLLSARDYNEYREHLGKEGYDYDFTKDFFQNFRNLFTKVQLQVNTNLPSAENANYADRVAGSKNVYLSNVVVVDCENVMYSISVKDYCKNIYHSIMVRDHCENVYMGLGVIKSFNIFYSKFIYNCSNVRFSKNLIGCHECIFCDNLENKSFCIENVQLSKDEYKKKKQEILSQKKSFYSRYLKLDNDGKNLASTHVEGDFIIQSEDITNAKFVYRNKIGNNLFLVGGGKGNEFMFDCIVSGSPYSMNCYGISNSGKVDHGYIGDILGSCSYIYYSFDLHHCNYCLGCVGLKNKEFCIFNKQYDKEEWFSKVDEIFSAMEKEGSLGEYFPASMNPFNYNDTLAYLMENIDENEALKMGFLRRQGKIEVDIPADAEIVSVDSLDDYEGNDEIIGKVIQDECGEVYSISKMEYLFLERYDLPLPNFHRFTSLKNHLL